MNTHIIHPGPEHLDRLSLLFDAYRQFYGKAGDLPGAREFLRQRMLHAQSILLLALDQEDQGAGFVQLYPCFSSTQMAPILILNDLFVAPSYRRHGVGRALMEAAHRYGRSVGALCLQLETGADNRQAQALYESLGWVRGSHYTYSLDLLQREDEERTFV